VKRRLSADGDPNSDPKSVVVKVKSTRRLPQRLADSHQGRQAAGGLELVRFSRLSVAAVTAEQWQRVVELAKEQND
jgi:predicted RNA-binding protein with PUA-like domain